MRTLAENIPQQVKEIRSTLRSYHCSDDLITLVEGVRVFRCHVA